MDTEQFYLVYVTQQWQSPRANMVGYEQRFTWTSTPTLTQTFEQIDLKCEGSLLSHYSLGEVV